MLGKCLRGQTLGLSLLMLLSGCEVAHNAQRDLNKLVHADPFTASKPASAPQARARGRRAGSTGSGLRRSEARTAQDRNTERGVGARTRKPHRQE